MPDTSEAEEWIDADTFVAKGKTYHVGLDGTVSEILNEREVIRGQGRKEGENKMEIDFEQFVVDCWGETFKKLPPLAIVQISKKELTDMLQKAFNMGNQME